VQIVAHRGASDIEPEHTLAAYVRAIDDGADALECDVRLSRDGVLVCLHDRRVDRTLAGRGPVSVLGLPQLAAWGVLTLERLLELVVDCGAPVQLAVETKHPTRYGALVEHSLVALLDRFGLARPGHPEDAQVRVMSFSRPALRRVGALAPTLPRVYLMARLPLHYRDGSLPPGVAIAGPSIGVLRRFPGYVARAHAHGHPVHVWTVDDDADVDLALRCGVDAIITNRPGTALSRIGRDSQRVWPLSA
jgi:glycerophosphoryl diester phosphodiesterase